MDEEISVVPAKAGTQSMTAANIDSSEATNSSEAPNSSEATTANEPGEEQQS